MKIKILRNTVAGGKVVQIGEIHDLPEGEANNLIASNKAEEVGKGDAIRHADPEPTNPDPKHAKKK